MQTTIGNFAEKASPVYPLYTMKGHNGLTASILPLGGTIQKIAVLDEAGQEIPLALGFSKPGPYESLVCYAGAALGPNAGRIRRGRLSLPGEESALAPNDGANQLHGGSHSLSSQLWELEDFACNGDSASLLLSASQPHGLDGWPGNRSYRVRYTLTDEGCFTIEYEAQTDRPTYFNLSNHTYWDLTGRFDRSALSQELTLHASRFCVNDAEHLPVGLMPVDGTAFDFRLGHTLDFALRSARDTVSKEQLAIARGFNHAYLLDGGPGLKSACLLRDSVSGRGMELLTDAPGIVFYSGGFLPEGLELNDGRSSAPSCAVALEAQDLPDCSRLRPAAFRPTFPGEIYRRVIQYRLHLPRVLSF